MPLQLMGGALITFPYIALLPVTLFVWLYLKTKSKLCRIAAGLWGLYAVYELGIKLGILCDANCNIRIDLLLIYPLLLLVSLLAIISATRHVRANQNQGR